MCEFFSTLQTNPLRDRACRTALAGAQFELYVADQPPVAGGRARWIALGSARISPLAGEPCEDRAVAAAPLADETSARKSDRSQCCPVRLLSLIVRK